MKIHITLSQSNRGFIIPMAALIIASFLILGVSATVFANGQNGSIWTTDNSDTSQDKNQYDQGDQVYIRGENLNPNTEYGYEITGLPGGASSDPNQIVASGNVQTDANGNFLIFAYVIQNDDSGEYKVSVGNKQDNYRINKTTVEDPTENPTGEPTQDPTVNPIENPTEEPTQNPTVNPTRNPTEEPTQIPPSVNLALNPPVKSNSLFLIPVTGVDQNNNVIPFLLSITALMLGISLIIISKPKQ